MTTLGRNDVCHCGSGKKYKKCHQEQDEARQREEKGLSTLAEWVRYHTRALCESVEAPMKDAPAVVAAGEGFFEGAARPAGHPFEDEAFRAYALYDLKSGEKPAISGAEIDPESAQAGDRAVLRDALAASHVSLHEVLETKLEKGVRLKDRLTGSEVFVWDAELAGILEPMQYVIARRVNFRDRPAIGQGWMPIYFHGRKKALAAIEARLAEAAVGEEAAARQTWLKANAPALYAIARSVRPGA